MTPSAVAKLVAEWRKAIVKLKDGLGDTPSYDLKRMIKERSEAFTICADELEALATAPPEQAAPRVRERIVSREEFNDSIADEAAQSCVDWSNPERRKEALRYILKQVWNEASADPPQPASDGALEKLVAKWRQNSKGSSANEYVRGMDYQAGICANELAAALASHDQKVREPLATWMIANSFATGHGDTVEDLLKELKWQIEESVQKVRAEVLEEAAQEIIRRSNKDWKIGSAMHTELQHAVLAIRSLAAAPAASKPEAGRE